MPRRKSNIGFDLSKVPQWAFMGILGFCAIQIFLKNTEDIKQTNNYVKNVYAETVSKIEETNNKVALNTINSEKLFEKFNYINDFIKEQRGVNNKIIDKLDDMNKVVYELKYQSNQTITIEELKES